MTTYDDYQLLAAQTVKKRKPAHEQCARKLCERAGTYRCRNCNSDYCRFHADNSVYVNSSTKNLWMTCLCAGCKKTEDS